MRKNSPIGTLSSGVPILFKRLQTQAHPANPTEEIEVIIVAVGDQEIPLDIAQKMDPYLTLDEKAIAQINA